MPLKPKFPTARQVDITEADLWRAMRCPRGEPQAQALRAAIQAGQAGDSDEAFAQLAVVHRARLAPLWEKVQARYAAMPDPSEDRVRDLLKHRIPAWHNVMVDFGPRLDWGAPILIETGSFQGFHYWGWSLPAQTAWIRDGREDCGDLLIDLVEQYADMADDPRWASGLLRRVSLQQLAVGAKMRQWSDLFPSLLMRDRLSAKTYRAFMLWFLRFGRAVPPQNPEFWAHNIQTHGCRGLLQVARMFPEFREAPKWDAFATDRLLEQATRGYFSDGCHEERVWGYSGATLSSLVDVWELTRDFGGLGDAEKPYWAALRKAHQFFARSVGPAPEYRMPTYGDAGHDNRATAILDRGDAMFGRGGEGQRVGVDRSQSYCFKPSGFLAMRNGDDADAVYANLSFGPFAGWHSHYDLLSMNVWAYGETMLEELCRFGPYSTPMDPMFRAPEAHNLVTIDGMVYDNRQHRGEDVVWRSDDAVDYFSATHWAYHYFVFGRDGGPVSPNIEAKVRRTVVLVKDPGYFVVLDMVSDRFKPAKFNRAITQRWHSPWRFRAEGATAGAGTRGKGVAMAWAHPEGLVRLDTGTDFTQAEGAGFGASYDRHHLLARRWMPLGHTGVVGFATLIFPWKGKRPDVSIRSLTADPDQWWRGETYEVTTPAGKDRLTIVPDPTAGDQPRLRAKLAGGRGTLDMA